MELLESIRLLDNRVSDLLKHIPQTPVSNLKQNLTQNAPSSQSWSIPEFVEALELKNKELEETMNEMEVEAEDTNRALDVEKAKVEKLTQEVDQLKQIIKQMKEEDMKRLNLSSVPRMEIAIQVEENDKDYSSLQNTILHLQDEISHHLVKQTSLQNTIRSLQSV